MSDTAGFDSADDADLWRRILQEDVAAFEIWHARHHSRLVLYLNARCRPPLDVEDLAQIVWIKVWQRKQQWNPTGGQFMSWLMQVAANSLKDQLRWKQRRPEQGLGEDADPPDRRATDERTEVVAMRACLEELGGPFVEVLRLRVVEELSDIEISQRLGIAAGTVSSRASRGKSEVRQCVERKLK